jgi:hypothetical protein
VVPGAIHPDYVDLSGDRQQLFYTIELEYPARDVLSFITSELRKSGWRSLKEDFLNPGVASSLTRGWVGGDDYAQQPAAYVYQWMADWENGAHDIAVYFLEYRYPLSRPPDLRTLHVVALYIPAKTARGMQHAAAAYRASHPSESANH